jgi:hypothetical protein
MASNRIITDNAEFEVPDSKMDKVMDTLNDNCTGARSRHGTIICPFSEVGRVEELRDCCKTKEIN